MPYDSLWRKGANGPTTLTLARDILLRKALVPEGVYSIYTNPGANEWLLVFSTDTKNWPTDPDRSKDFASIAIPVKKQSSVTQQFTIGLNETKKGGQFQFSWDDTIATADFEFLK